MARRPERHFEAKMRIVVLRVAADAPNGTVTTPDAKARAARYFTPTEGDLRLNPKHGNEPMYYQIVGNVIGSHANSRTSLYYKGYAERTDDGIRITDKGREYLKNAPTYE
jgi:hypothetical protein